ncbi:putative triacylglycerol lipase [Helianthus annuus]|nr:putative triacylglycerol lipase [Helianthus annuus]
MTTSIYGASLNLTLTLSFLCVLLFGSGCLCESVPGLYVFGDSLVDVGNNNYLAISLAKADFPHNGVDFPTGKATGRFSNGKNAADFLGTFRYFCTIAFANLVRVKMGQELEISF